MCEELNERPEPHHEPHHEPRDLSEVNNPRRQWLPSARALREDAAMDNHYNPLVRPDVEPEPEAEPEPELEALMSGMKRRYVTEPDPAAEEQALEAACDRVLEELTAPTREELLEEDPERWQQE